MFEPLKNKNIMVTGATSGIGRVLTERLSLLGCNLAFCGRSEQKMQQVVTNLATMQGLNYYQTFDITDYALISNFVEKAISRLGDIDILINCAGVNSSREAIKDLDINDMEWMLKVNMLAPFVFMQDTYNKSMKAQGKGMIINVMSTVCSFSNEGIGAYTASKSGFDALTKVFRKELREQNIKVCAIYPGGVDTPFRESKRPQYLDPNSVVDSIVHIATQSGNACIDELVIRPMIEKNYS